MKENQSLIQEHDEKLGRTTIKNRAIARGYEHEIKQYKTAVEKVNKILSNDTVLCASCSEYKSRKAFKKLEMQFNNICNKCEKLKGESNVK